MGLFLPQRSLPGLKKYKYSSEDHSPISKYILKPFYARAVCLFPRWVAPNLITLFGLGFSLVGVVTALIYNPTFTQECPSWVYYSFAVEMFLYQTFDACDGLQARRTGTSSPLGELFDHTVDAINTTLGVIIFAATMNIPPWFIVLGEFSTTLNFYLSTWEEFHTGTLFLSSFSGPVEGVLMIIGMQTLTGLFGHSIWTTPVLLGYSVSDVYLPFFALGLLFNIIAASSNVATSLAKKGVPLYKALQGIIPVAVFWFGIVSWLLTCPELAENLVAVILSIGVVSALLVGRIILAHVVQGGTFPMWNPLLFLPYVAIAVHHIAIFLKAPVVAVDFAVLWLNLGLSLGVYAFFVGEIIYEITDYLGINCLTIKEKSD